MIGQSRSSLTLDGVLLGGRGLLLMGRRPASIASAIVFPLLFTLLYFAVFEGAMDRIGVDFAQHLVPAVVTQAMFFTGMSSAVLAAEDATSGLISRLRSMPVSRSAPFTGALVAFGARAVISTAALVPFGLLLGFRFRAGPLAALGFVGAAVAFALTACAGYLALGLRVRVPDVAQAMVMLPYFPLLLMSNAFTPTEMFPGWLQPVVRNQPVSQTIDALRALSADGQAIARPAAEAAAWLVPLFTVFAVLATRAFGRS